MSQVWLLGENICVCGHVRHQYDYYEEIIYTWKKQICMWKNKYMYVEIHMWMFVAGMIM